MASQVPYEPKQMWRPKQKAPCEASGVATPQVHLSREDKGKMPACFDETVSREVSTATMPSPNSEAVTPRANLILISEATDGVARTAPRGTHEVPDSQARAPSGANLLRNKEANRTPQRALPPSSSNVKLALRSIAKGSSLSVDSGAYAASAPKDISKVLSREVRAKALSSANLLSSKEADKVPQCVPLPSSSSTKLTLRSGAKGSSLNVDSGAYAASAPKDIPKVLNRESRAKALFSAILPLQ